MVQGGNCGSSNVLEWLGYEFTDNEEILRGELAKAGITFLHAPLFHPKLKSVSHIRKELGINTIFNALGPVCNPCEPDYSVVGVSYMNDTFIDDYRGILNNNCTKFAIITDANGYDEISLTAPFTVTQKYASIEFTSDTTNLIDVKPDEIRGGKTVQESGEIMVRILNRGGSEGENNVVAANAALGFMMYDNITFVEGIRKAKEILKSGGGFEVLRSLVGVNLEI